jgi:hypothetical protein
MNGSNWNLFVKWLGNDEKDFIKHLRKDPKDFYPKKALEYFVIDAFDWKSTGDRERWAQLHIRWVNHLTLQELNNDILYYGKKTKDV